MKNVAAQRKATTEALKQLYQDLQSGKLGRDQALQSIRLIKEQEQASTASLVLAAPVWENRALASTAAAPGQRHVLLCGFGSGSDAAFTYLDDDYAAAALACFERLQAIIKTRPQERLLVQLAAADDAMAAGLSALLRTASLEQPLIATQLVLLPAATGRAELLDYLAQEAGAADSVVRYRDGVRQVLAWQRSAPVFNPAIAFKDSGVYLITGGMGGVGRLFAREILEQTRHSQVLLCGRTPLAGERLAAFDALGGSGRLAYDTVDLDDAASVQRLIGRHGRLNGILHCAGMTADAHILHKSADDVARVLAPKVAGTLHLDEASRDLDLDFFVLFSSLAGAFGNAGQADYAAANGFMDQFAQQRARQVEAGTRRGRTVAVNWPLWDEGGMRIEPATRALLLRQTGMLPLRTASAMQAFHAALAMPGAQAMVMEGDARRIEQVLRSQSLLPVAVPAPAPSGAGTASADLAEQTMHFLRKELGAVLKLGWEQLDPRAPWEDYGFDSILAVSLIQRLEQSFGPLSKTLFFEYHTTLELSEYFLDAHRARLDALFSTSSLPAAPVAPTRMPARARPRVQAAPDSGADAIAIIGLAGRYPGADDLDAYWRNLRDGKDCITEVPPSRWTWQDYYSEDREQAGHHYSKWGGFIGGVDEFDPRFFNISPRDAKTIDPQERLFLQHAWMALEDAGYTRAALQALQGPQGDDLPGQVGVYAGLMYSEYQLFAAEAGARGTRIGVPGSFASIANRVSYALNLHGPSMTVDTMCSSSLTAIHLACQDLKLGRTAMAIAGGVNVTIHPNKYLMLSGGQFISGDGHCQSFGEGGDGYIPGEGVGVVVLKPLAQAERDGDHIYGVIRASAINHGGKTNGYTVPNPRAQAGVIGRALASAQIDPRQIGYVEAHGTGTKLGDPIEIAALTQAFQRHAKDTQLCFIGSAKSNIGHCESAAGIAGLTKVLLQLRHGQIAPSLHSARLNPHIDFDRTPFVVNQQLRDWEAPQVDGRSLPRVAGLSSFGAGGSNAHLVIEEYRPAPPRSRPAAGALPVPLSARTAAQLQQKVRELRDFLAVNEVDLTSLAYTLQVGREAMSERLALVVSTIDELRGGLDSVLAGDSSRCVGGAAGPSVSADLLRWVQGGEIDWSTLHGDTQPTRVSLPTYPFARERYWLDEVIAIPAPAAGPATLHPLLHANTSTLDELRFSSTFGGKEPCFTGSARVFSSEAYLELARAALVHGMPGAPQHVGELAWGVPYTAAMAERGVALHIALIPAGEGAAQFEIYSGDGEETAIHCQGKAGHGAAAMPQALPVPLPVQVTRSGGLALSEPAPAVSFTPVSARARVSLAALDDVAAVSPALVAVRALGRGVFTLTISAGADNLLSAELTADLLQAFATLRQEPGLQVLLIEGSATSFLHGGRAQLDAAVAAGLFAALADLPCPTIAVLQGEAHGAGFLLAALCDLMVCSADARYSLALAAGVAEEALLRARFGDSACDALLYRTAPVSGVQLREYGMRCAVVAGAECAGHALALANNLAGKQPSALRLLKAHLAQPLRALVTNMALSAPVAPATNGVMTASSANLSSVLAEAAETGCSAVLLTLDQPGLGDDDLTLAALIDVLLAAPLPVVAVLEAQAGAAGLLAAQCADAIVVRADAVHAFDRIDADWRHARLAAAATAVFTARFGPAQGAALLLAGRAYSGAQLQALSPHVHAAADVAATALDLAGAMAPGSRAAWRAALAARIAQTAELAAPAIDGSDQRNPPSSDVLSATLHDDGVLEVAMHDRAERNMFSQALADALHGVFGWVAASSICKAVVLTGYDSYFASGGTKDNLIAIHEGKVRFTDNRVYELALACKLPVIAAMQGHAIGAGWCLGMFADVAILAEESQYLSPYMDYGFTPGAGATFIFPHKVGDDVARETLLTAQPYSGLALRQRGIGMQVLPRAEVHAAALALAHALARSPVERLLRFKQMLSQPLRAPLEQAYAQEAHLHELTFVGQNAARAQIEERFPHAAAAQTAVATPVASSASLAALTGAMGKLLAAELQLAEHEVAPHTEFIDLGMDSITGVTWIRKINEHYGLQLEATKIYAYATLAKLAAYVHGQLPQPAEETATAESLDAVSAELRRLLAAELHLREDELGEHAEFIDLGMDSITGVTWVRKIGDRFGIVLEATRIYSYPTLAKMSRHVHELLGAGSSAAPVPELSQPIAAPVEGGMLTSLRRQARPVAAAAPDAIAVIGMAGQFPQARTVDEFWRNIAEGRNCIGEVGPERWRLDEFYQSGDPVPGKTNSRWFGALADFDRFDPLFFNISPGEAQSMDPQQRLFLEACWHGIEDAGYNPRALSGAKCGVFAGCAAGDYHLLSDEVRLSAQGFTGGAASILAARIAYFLNLQGPCLSIDTACSSSLVAIASACDSLNAGSSDIALAGGVYVMAGPEMQIKTAQAGMLSQDGRCYTFDQRANGFVPGEAVGVVVLKRLADAQRDGDHIHGVVQGWGVNQDGKTNGITAPNPESQTRLQQDVYERFGIDPAAIGLIEAHGTGTKLGDPIEVEALRNTFAKYTAQQGYCALGSVKSNIGHCLTAAGIASFIKLMLSLKHGQLPPTINFDQLNEHITLEGSPFYVNRALRAWNPAAGRPRVAALSSFGFSGTNAHLVVAQHAAIRPRAAHAGPAIVPLSAKTPAQLEQAARKLLEYLRGAAAPDLHEVAHTLQAGREAMDERLAIVAASMPELIQQLDAFIAGAHGAGLHLGQQRRYREGLNLVSEEAEVRDALVAKWIAARELSKLAGWWVKGLEVDWSRLYGTNRPARIALPGYPFARERYWIEAQGAKAAVTGLPALLERNTSDLYQYSYAVARRAAPYEAAACLDMARAALAHALPAGGGEIGLEELSWPVPMPDAEVSLSVLLYPQDEGEPVGFAIASMQAGEQRIHCAGRALVGVEPVAEGVQELFYEEVWTPCTLAPGAAAGPTLYCVDPALEAELAGGAGTLFARREQAGDVGALIAQAHGGHGEALSIVYAWASGRQEAGVHALFDLFRAVKEADAAVARVVLIGRYDPALAETCWDHAWIGFARSLRLLMPDLNVTLVYTTDGACSAAQLSAAIQAGRVVWFKHGQAHLLSIAPAAPPPALAAAPLREGGTYLITGGCGALGMAFARHLAVKVGARLHLLGRRLPTPDMQQALAALSQAGAREVRYHALDIADRAGLSDWAAQLDQPLSGVFHAAGNESFTPFHEKDAVAIDAVLRPKTIGTMLLDEVLHATPAAKALDFVCYFASSAAMLGDFGSCDYAIANRFQMAYGQHRAQRADLHGKTIVINWPLWQRDAEGQAGMGQGDPLRAAFYLKSSGQQALEQDAGIRIFERLAQAQRVQTLVMVGAPARVSQFLERVQQGPAPAVAHSAPRAVASVPTHQASHEQLVQELRGLVCGALKIAPGRLDDHVNLADYGFDSIGLAAFARQLSAHFAIEVTPALFFSHATVAQLAQHFAASHAQLVAAHRVHSAHVPVAAPAPAASLPLRSRPARAPAARSEAIAIVGMAGRFPQAADVDAFWELLAGERSGIGEIPANRWNWRDYFVAPGHPGNRISTNKGGFIDGVDEFDPLFFEVSPREAEEMDPGERLLLSTAYHAIEDARMSPAALRGAKVGVFVGMEESYYAAHSSQQGVTTAGGAMISSRLSYFLDLHGPAIATNTACSSGLVALHQAAHSLRQGECDSALVAGLALNLEPQSWVKMSEAGMLSPDGQCRSFARQANGIAIGDAVVVLMLKPLSAAQADGDRIYGTIRASGINFDGKTNGVTAPNGRMQAQLIEDVYTRAGIAAADVSHIVAHGTGTKLGDPVEINALNEAFRKLGPRSSPIALTSTKSNVGHTLAASGLVSVVGLLKGIQHRKIPASLHCEAENEYISAGDGYFRINKSTTDWDAGGKPRMGGVSAFGRSGTNAHVVIEEYQAPVVVRAGQPAGPVLVPLSARTPAQLDDKVADLLRWLDAHPAIDLADLAYTLQTGREAMDERLVLVVGSHAELRAALAAWLDGERHLEHGYAGSAVEGRASVGLFKQDEDMLEAIGKWLAAGKLLKLAQLWAQGLDLDWQRMHAAGQRRRIDVPRYPFARERYWIATAPLSAPPSAPPLSVNTAPAGDAIEDIEGILSGIEDGSMETVHAIARLKRVV